MSDEEFERYKSFILEQQAKSAVKIAQIEDTLARLVQATLNRFEATDKRIDDVDERISALVDSQIRTEENINRTEEMVKKTDENLRNLIAVVDRYFRDRNGKAGE